MRIDAVVADLDGTLVRPDYSVSNATLAALDSVRAVGIPVVIATARTPAGLLCLQPLAHRVDLAVCCSGAIGWSGHLQTTLWQEMLAQSTIQHVVELIVAQRAGVASFDGVVWRMTEKYNELSPGQPQGPVRRIVDVEELSGSPCSTMAVRHSGGELAGLEELLEGRAKAAISQVGHSLVLDITPLGIDKGTGVRRALATLGVDPGAAISFGDMPNDLPLFAVTGRSYAVGDRHPAVVSAADEVLLPVECDGFSHKIAELATFGWVTK